jgi:mono/diheme cytochrome c family protein
MGVPTRPRTVRTPTRAVVVAAVLAIAVAGLATWTLFHADGFSTRAEPSWAERGLSRLARRWAVPARAREARNPVAFSEEIWKEARAHFADHCASCHGNDGSGQTELGRNLYPRAPDMRLAETQTLGDGEIYWIIENGIRLTGMPAWGDGSDHDVDTWKLVHFVRHLGHLTPDHLKEMEALNPKSPADLAEDQSDDRFLAGQDTGLAPDKPEHHHHKEQP